MSQKKREKKMYRQTSNNIEIDKHSRLPSEICRGMTCFFMRETIAYFTNLHKPDSNKNK